MARLVSALHDAGAPTSVLVATSGDTGSAVGHAFHHVPHTRVIILYSRRPRKPEAGSATDHVQRGGWDERDERMRLPEISTTVSAWSKQLRRTPRFLERVRLTSANSINIGRLLPQMVYYFHAIAQLGPSLGDGRAIVSTPSGNFGNLTAGLMAKRAGLPVNHFVAATNINDVVPSYLSTGAFVPRPSKQTLSNAMDVGNPSSFDRMVWMYGDVDAMRRDISGSRHMDDEVVATIRRVYEGGATCWILTAPSRTSDSSKAE